LHLHTPFAYALYAYVTYIRICILTLHTMIRMVLQGETKIYKSGSRHSIYVPSGVINDSAFPFAIGEELTIRIENDRIIVEKIRKKVRA